MKRLLSALVLFHLISCGQENDPSSLSVAGDTEVKAALDKAESIRDKFLTAAKVLSESFDETKTQGLIDHSREYTKTLAELGGRLNALPTEHQSKWSSQVNLQLERADKARDVKFKSSSQPEAVYNLVEARAARIVGLLKQGSYVAADIEGSALSSESRLDANGDEKVHVKTGNAVVSDLTALLSKVPNIKNREVANSTINRLSDIAKRAAAETGADIKAFREKMLIVKIDVLLFTENDEGPQATYNLATSVKPAYNIELQDGKFRKVCENYDGKVNCGNVLALKVFGKRSQTVFVEKITIVIKDGENIKNIEPDVFKGKTFNKNDEIIYAFENPAFIEKVIVSAYGSSATAGPGQLDIFTAIPTKP